MGVWSVWGRMRERCKSVNKCKWEANHSKWQPTGTHLIWWLAPAHLSFDRSHQILRKYCDNIAAAAIFAIFLLHKAPWSFFLLETLINCDNILWKCSLIRCPFHGWWDCDSEEADDLQGSTATSFPPAVKTFHNHRHTTPFAPTKVWNKGAKAGKISVWSFELHYSYTVRLVNMRVSWIMNMPTCDASVYTIFVPGSGPS